MKEKIICLKNSPIGFFDSGVGGISVLRESLEVMPNESYIYYGDSKNAPYGTKTVEEVRALSYNVVDFLLAKGVKGIVVACNTATSAVVAELRKKYPKFPIVGIEPALKPAVESNKEGKIIIMATTMTLAEGKFNRLLDRLAGDRRKDVVPLPCPGLVEFIENGILEGPELEEFLKEKFSQFKDEKIATIVLGCTHYPFIKETLAKIVGEDVDIIDGSLGTSKEMKRRLAEQNLLNDSNQAGEITVYNSAQDQKLIDLSYELIKNDKVS
ncbi:MAG: glutamate racemase [Sarcina sp.]